MPEKRRSVVSGLRNIYIYEIPNLSLNDLDDHSSQCINFKVLVCNTIMYSVRLLSPCCIQTLSDNIKSDELLETKKILAFAANNLGLVEIFKNGLKRDEALGYYRHAFPIAHNLSPKTLSTLGKLHLPMPTSFLVRTTHINRKTTNPTSLLRSPDVSWASTTS